MRIAVIGRGKWGMNIVRTLATMRDVELIDESKNFDVVLRQQPAAVLIATPSATHAEVAIPFIDAGVPTFIEKPMATTLADAIRIREAALRSGAPVVVGHVHLYNPAFQAAKKLLPEVETVQAVFWAGMNHRPRTDSSVLWDWLPHGLSMAQALFDVNPSFAQAWGVGEAVAVQGGNRQLCDHWRPVHRERQLDLAAEASSHDDCRRKQLAHLRRYRGEKAIAAQIPGHVVPCLR